MTSGVRCQREGEKGYGWLPGVTSQVFKIQIQHAFIFIIAFLK
jgi:hypothetical protein